MEIRMTGGTETECICGPDLTNGPERVFKSIQRITVPKNYLVTENMVPQSDLICLEISLQYKIYFSITNFLKKSQNVLVKIEFIFSAVCGGL